MPAQGATLTDFTDLQPDAVVIGGGVVGLAVAWEAARRGLRPLVLERGQPGAGTSHVAAGMIAPVSEAAFREPDLLALNLASAELYPAWARELADSSGIDPGYQPCGSLLVARDRDQAEALERELEFRLGQGLAVKRLTASAALETEPALGPGIRLALSAPGDHVVDPRRLVGALAAAVARCGGEVRGGAEVTAIERRGDRITGVRLTGGESIASEQVVVAAGCWSSALAGLPDGAPPPLRPVKGQLLILRSLEGGPVLSRAVRSEEVYLVPRGADHVVVGATREERGWDTTVTAGAVLELLREAAELVPAVRELAVEEALAGLRPTTPDNAPLIGAGALEGLLWATGHYRHGVALAPVTGRAVAALLAGEPAPDVAAPFAPERFAAVAA